MSALDIHATSSLRKFLQHPLEHVDEEQQLSRDRQLIAGYAQALCSGDLELQNMILATGLDLQKIKQIMGYDYVQQRLYYALEEAVKCSKRREMDRLIDIGALPNAPHKGRARHRSKSTPLRWAVDIGDTTTVWKLITLGADVNSPMEAHVCALTTLQAAVWNRDLCVVDWLIQAGADVNAPPSVYGKTAIEQAASQGNLDMVNCLLEAEANIRGKQNTNYRRTVYWAQKNGHVSAVNILHAWKTTECGEQDCYTIDNIMSSMTLDELNFPSEEARITHFEELEQEENELGSLGMN
ncbi:hypothetical protein G6011_04263 [Alternaria panax]|uniref:Ankyrin repeat protein n=1 Tax=Alternaria panax TaxID=48097 RepID=A0AAD4NTU8_9PLEO|nr:hypothetical protein G6011_04263 [Alternaria panax]